MSGKARIRIRLGISQARPLMLGTGLTFPLVSGLFLCGESGIRTLGGLHLNGFQDRTETTIMPGQTGCTPSALTQD